MFEVNLPNLYSWTGMEKVQRKSYQFFVFIEALITLIYIHSNQDLDGLYEKVTKEVHRKCLFVIFKRLSKIIS